uniref:Protein translation factor SUI1 homolog n=1 Tax=Ananas comosus var. bracteatus TaxID=296719 RepID=A0A6V7NKY5_ANACO|nr:unnamed protein product [Ananas comosus var. bracteatus]
MHVAVDLDRPTNRHHPNRLFQEKRERPRVFYKEWIIKALAFFRFLFVAFSCPNPPISVRTSLYKRAKLYPFAEANAEDSGAGAGVKEYVHIRIQQRNGRKSLTTVQGLKKEFSYNKILKDLKKEFCCNGTVVQDPELGQVIQLQGDQRKNVSNFLVQAGIVKKDHIKIHGF